MSNPVQTSLPAARSADPRVAPARAAASLAAVALLANAAIGLLGDVDDHTIGLGMLSEVTAGFAFLAGAAALALLAIGSGWRRLLWLLAPVGMTIAGLTMAAVPIIGSEPGEILFVLAVVPTFVGLVAAGLLGAGRRWPWWTGAGLALFLPIMFLAPLNSVLMTLVWGAVALTARRLDPERSS
jgi:hypothetical protein